MEDRDIKQLIRKYLNNECTDQERALLETWYLEHEEKDIPEFTSRQWKEIELSSPGKYRPVRRLGGSFRRIAAAIAFLITISVGIYLIIGNRQPAIRQQAAVDILPGGNRAVLILPNGRTVDLRGDKEGIMIDEGRLTYEDGDEISEVSDAFSDGMFGSGQVVLTTPRGGQYQVYLPDGSSVQLNSATTLKYPSSFDGKEERRVELSGEAYFEVTRNRDMPFLVSTEKQTVTVLGTHFNINSYQDEPVVKTTVLEGSVRVTPAGSADNLTESTILKPNQQSILSEMGLATVTVNPAGAIDWINGEFVFRKESVESIMRKIARWYDVSVEYRDSLPVDEAFSGSVSRFDNVSTVLEMLEATGDVRFEIEDREILVYRSGKQGIKKGD